MSQEPLLYLAAAQQSKIVDSLLQTSKQGIKPSCSVALGKIINVTPELKKLKGLFFFWQTGSAQIQIFNQPADRKKAQTETKNNFLIIFLLIGPFFYFPYENLI